MRVPQFGDEYHTMLAHFDQGRALLSRGQQGEGRRVLQALLAKAEGGLRAALLMVLARSYYSTQEFASARQSAAQVVAMDNASSDAYLRNFVSEAHTIITEVDESNQSSIRCEPQSPHY